MIYIVYGTRAELIKFSSLIRELKKRKVKFETIDTGQHNNKSLIKSLKLPEPDHHLGKSFRDKWSKLEASKSTYPLASVLALFWGLKTFVKLSRIISKGDIVVTHGNAMGVPLTIYASRLGKIIHMESGFRGNTKTSRLDDMFYKFADKRSDILFTPYESTRKNLKSAKINGRIILSGDVMKDVVKDTLKIKSKIKKPKGIYILANITRSIITKHDAKQLLHAILDSPINIIFIMNPVIKNRVEKFGLKNLIKSDHVKIMNPVDYPDFLHLMKNSIGCITDSTGVEEECAILGKPCIVTTDFLQIKELEQEGIVKRSGCNYISILGNLKKIKNGKWKIKNKKILGKGSPTKIIANYLIKLRGKK